MVFSPKLRYKQILTLNRPIGNLIQMIYAIRIETTSDWTDIRLLPANGAFVLPRDQQINFQNSVNHASAIRLITLSSDYLMFHKGNQTFTACTATLYLESDNDSVAFTIGRGSIGLTSVSSDIDAVNHNTVIDNNNNFMNFRLRLRP